jgi:NAD(P)-dependent dehydrogenase (short-subunit alcohol dehydrogenase family)
MSEGNSEKAGFLDARARLVGRAAVVIGGAGGLGRACVEDLGRCGVELTVCDRDTTALESISAWAHEDDVTINTIEGDGRDPAVLERIFTSHDRRFSRLDVLVNVVGGTFRQPFEENTAKGWDALIRTNFTWLLTSTQMAIPRMRAAGGGSIVNLTSIEAHRAAPNFAVYAAMKAAVTNFSKTLAVELGPDGIRVNCIAADLVPTESLRAIGDHYLDALTEAAPIGIPMGRTGLYTDVGGCAIFLASDLSVYVTGTTLHPDGGVYASSGWSNWLETGWSNLPPGSVLDAIRQQRDSAEPNQPR